MRASRFRTHEGVGLVRVDDAFMHTAKPGVEGRFANWWDGGCDLNDLIEECGFAFDGEGCNAAEDESDDEENQPEADSAEMMGCGGGHEFSVVGDRCGASGFANASATWQVWYRLIHIGFGY